jgi:hypothetical protein
MTPTNETLDFLEAQIPELAGAATRIAFWNALTAGCSVVVAEADSLVEIFPNGTKSILGPLMSLAPPRAEAPQPINS